jgi:hypothetical protein
MDKSANWEMILHANAWASLARSYEPTDVYMRWRIVFRDNHLEFRRLPQDAIWYVVQLHQLDDKVHVSGLQLMKPGRSSPEDLAYDQRAVEYLIRSRLLEEALPAPVPSYVPERKRNLYVSAAFGASTWEEVPVHASVWQRLRQWIVW